MLALKRKQGESITITIPDGRVIVLEIVDSCYAYVKVAVQAPSDVSIVRTELIGARGLPGRRVD